MVSSIQEGLCVLVGIKREDTAEDVEYIGHFPFQQPSAPTASLSCLVSNEFTPRVAVDVRPSHTCPHQ